jgi:hypothetical protein
VAGPGPRAHCQAPPPAPKNAATPLWLGLLILLLVTYSGGMAVGWATWGRNGSGETHG